MHTGLAHSLTGTPICSFRNGGRVNRYVGRTSGRKSLTELDVSKSALTGKCLVTATRVLEFGP